jgi:cytochrome c553
MTRTRRSWIGGTSLVVLLGVAVGVGEGAELKGPGYETAALCSACHGFNGNSRSDAVPILAGMPAWYMKKAIADYATGRRVSPEMEPFSKAVQILGVDALAAFFAAQRREPSPVRVDRAAAARGREASAKCAACHGPDGAGDEAKRVPSIAGQPAGYLRNQMLLFKADTRSPGDPALRQLKAVMQEFSDAQLGDLAAYYSGLR